MTLTLSMMEGKSTERLRGISAAPVSALEMSIACEIVSLIRSTAIFV